MSAPLAIRLRGVVKRFGPITAVDGLDLDVPGGHVRRPARPQRRGQVDDDEDAHRAGDRRRGRAGRARLHGCPASPSRRARECGVVPQLDNLDVTLTVEQNLIVFAFLYRLGRRERRAAVERALEIANLADRARHAGRQALGRHAPAAADRARARPPAAARAARRADRRPRSAGPPGAVGADRPAALRGHVDPDVDALHRGGRAARRPRDDHVARPRGRDRAAAGAGASSTPGARRSRSTARPARLAEVEAEARAAGLATRRTGTSVALLRLNGDAPEGERRPANLEDVFVLLTGEEIA